MQRLVEQFEPAHPCLTGVGRAGRPGVGWPRPDRQPPVKVERPGGTRRHGFTAPFHGLQHLLNGCHGLDQGTECHAEFAVAGQCSLGVPALALTEYQTKFARGLVGLIEQAFRFGRKTSQRAALGARIPGEVEYLRRRNRVTKKQAGHFRQLVCLVEDHRVGTGQQFSGALILQHDIGKKQVVIDHHDVGFLRAATCRQHETVGMKGALTAQAVVAGGADLRPDRRGFGHTGQLTPVARGAGGAETLDFPDLARLFAAGQPSLADHTLQMMMADVVGAPLEQGDVDGNMQQSLHHGQVAVKQLVLQGARAGRHDHLAAGQQGGHQIGERLAGAGTGLDDQAVTVAHGTQHGCCHFLLSRAGTEIGPAGSEQSCRAQYGRHFGIDRIHPCCLILFH